MRLDMIRVEVDGRCYDFDSYDDLETTKGILEDILRQDCERRVKTKKVVLAMRKVLETGRSAHI